MIFQVVGRGTDLLLDIPGTDIEILGPLGKGFTLVEKKKVLLVGGGAGTCYCIISKKLKEKGCEVTQVYGSRSKGLICDRKIATANFPLCGHFHHRRRLQRNQGLRHRRRSAVREEQLRQA